MQFTGYAWGTSRMIRSSTVCADLNTLYCTDCINIIFSLINLYSRPGTVKNFGRDQGARLISSLKVNCPNHMPPATYAAGGVLATGFLYDAADQVMRLMRFTTLYFEN